jgi:hypothetical protein
MPQIRWKTEDGFYARRTITDTVGEDGTVTRRDSTEFFPGPLSVLHHTSLLGKVLRMVNDWAQGGKRSPFAAGVTQELEDEITQTLCLYPPTIRENAKGWILTWQDVLNVIKAHAGELLLTRQGRQLPDGAERDPAERAEDVEKAALAVEVIRARRNLTSGSKAILAARKHFEALALGGDEEGGLSFRAAARLEGCDHRNLERAFFGEVEAIVTEINRLSA